VQGHRVRLDVPHPLESVDQSRVQLRHFLRRGGGGARLQPVLEMMPAILHQVQVFTNQVSVCRDFVFKPHGMTPRKIILGLPRFW
jgi:hypothetical protein